MLIFCISGTVEGFSNVVCYVSCSNCRRKVHDRNASECDFCHFDLEMKEDFRFHVDVSYDENGVEKNETLLGFKSSLDFYVAGEKPQEEIEEELNGLYEGKQCSLTFTWKENVEQTEEETTDTMKIVESFQILD